MRYTQWGNRRKQGDEHVVSLLDDQGSQILDLPQNWPSEEFGVTVDGQEWRVLATDTDLQATLPGGQVFSANSGDKKFTRAKRLEIQLGQPISAINEQRNDWVYVASDAEETKLGQFSGGNNGVRKSITEFEEDSGLGREEKIFLSLVTKRTLESRLSVSTWSIIIGLVLLIPVIIFAAL